MFSELVVEGDSVRAEVLAILAGLRKITSFQVSGVLLLEYLINSHRMGAF